MGVGHMVCVRGEAAPQEFAVDLRSSPLQVTKKTLLYHTVRGTIHMQDA